MRQGRGYVGRAREGGVRNSIIGSGMREGSNRNFIFKNFDEGARGVSVGAGSSVSVE